VLPQWGLVFESAIARIRTNPGGIHVVNSVRRERQGSAFTLL
jgi:hypothetical protein